MMKVLSAFFMRHLKPKLVNPIDLITRQMGSMSAQIIIFYLIAGADYAKTHLPLWFLWQSFPGLADALCLLFRRHYRRATGDQFRRVELRRRVDDRLKYVRRRDHQKVNVLAGLLCKRDHFAEKILFVSREKLFLRDILVPG